MEIRCRELSLTINSRDFDKFFRFLRGFLSNFFTQLLLLFIIFFSFNISSDELIKVVSDE
ncbi:unnamed protein product [Meloidogyne enterolobii]|uniref:Uncharacterized protein n=1 Tax=Meloidogyne enterolobii TaxID=390850 RepID=A0ACB0Y1Z8_MELEN